MILLNVLMWIATHIILPIGVLMFATWAYAMYKIRKEPSNGKFKIDEGSFTYWATRVALFPWTLFGETFVSQFRASPRKAWEETHNEFVKYECKSLCGLFWRTLLLLLVLIPGMILFIAFILIALPVVPIVLGLKIAFLGIIDGSLIDLITDKMSESKEEESETLPPITLEIDEQALAKHAYRYYLQCRREKNFIHAQKIFERDLEFLNQIPADRKHNHLIYDVLWHYTSSFVIHGVFRMLGMGVDELQKWLSENPNEEFMQKVKRAAIAGNAILCNQYPVRSLVYSLKKTACPMVEFVPAPKSKEA